MLLLFLYLQYPMMIIKINRYGSNTGVELVFYTNSHHQT